MATRYRMVTDDQGVTHREPIPETPTPTGQAPISPTRPAITAPTWLPQQPPTAPGPTIMPRPNTDTPTFTNSMAGRPMPLTGLQPKASPGAIPTMGGSLTGLQPKASPGAMPTGAGQAGGAPGTLPAATPQGVGGQPLQEFGPGNDLRSTQINPFTGQRLRGVQNDTDVLFRSLTQGPSLTDAALDKFKLLGEQTAEQRQLGIRNIGQAAARLGRLGSGMVTTDLGNLEDVLQTREQQARRGLASDVAFGEGAERRANLGAGSAFESQLYGQGRGLRDEARTERGFQEDQARRAQDQEILRRQLEVQYQQYLQQLGMQGAGMYGDQAAAGQQAASDLLAGAFRKRDPEERRY